MPTTSAEQLHLRFLIRSATCKATKVVSLPETDRELDRAWQHGVLQHNCDQESSAQLCTGNRFNFTLRQALMVLMRFHGHTTDIISKNTM